MPSILVVDDELGLRQLAIWDLRQKGFDVSVAEDGVHALEQMKTSSFDVVITDITMPRMEGLTLLKEIRTAYPDVEVIVVTGFGTVEMAVSAMKLGAFDFILKPYDAGAMEAKIREALKKRGWNF